MNSDEEKEEDSSATASCWLIPVEPEVEIEEYEKDLEMIEEVDVEEGNVEEQSSDSEEENNLQAVQEFESVLVDKMCEVCGNFFQTFEVINAEPNKPLLSTCETCSYYISRPLVVIDGSGSITEFSCDKCPKKFARKDKLLRHKVTHSEKRPFSCDLCDKSYKRQDTLTEHLKLFHPEKKKDVRDKCNSCGASDNLITLNVGENEAEFIKLCESCNLSRQEQISKVCENGSKLFPCDLCSRSFSRRDHVVRHRLSHLDVKPFECSICKKSFSRNDRLVRHMKTHPGAKPFSCKVCSKAFADRENLKIHLSTHKKQNGRGYPVKCEICGKELRDNDRLQKHLTSHENKKHCVCEVCGKAFKLKGTLLAHQRLHSDLNPFKCEICGMEFKIRDNLSRHLLVHTSDKTYSCNICSKTFKRKDKLKAHNLVHIDIKPYTCELCNRAFKRKDKYTRHIKQVHKSSSKSNMTEDGETEIICTVCGLAFLCIDDLTEHKMVHYR